MKRWDNHSKKLNDAKKNLKLYNHFLANLTIFLNNYHNRIIQKNIGQLYWVHGFIGLYPQYHLNGI